MNVRAAALAVIALVTSMSDASVVHPGCLMLPSTESTVRKRPRSAIQTPARHAFFSTCRSRAKWKLSATPTTSPSWSGSTADKISTAQMYDLSPLALTGNVIAVTLN
jgi:hypothetical protein